jgi:hypothetical protein
VRSLVPPYSRVLKVRFAHIKTQILTASKLLRNFGVCRLKLVQSCRPFPARSARGDYRYSLQDRSNFFAALPGSTTRFFLRRSGIRNVERQSFVHRNGAPEMISVTKPSDRQIASVIVPNPKNRARNRLSRDLRTDRFRSNHLRIRRRTGSTPQLRQSNCSAAFIVRLSWSFESSRGSLFSDLKSALRSHSCFCSGESSS